MPRDIDDDEPVAKPTAKRKKRPAAETTESGPWKALGVTFGCVLVAFAGIMIFVMSKAPKAGDVAAGDPPGSGGGAWVPQLLKRPAIDVPAGALVVIRPSPDRPPVRWRGTWPHLERFAVLGKGELLIGTAQQLDGRKMGVRDARTGQEVAAGPLLGDPWLFSLTASPDGTAAFVWLNGTRSVGRFDATTRTWAIIDGDIVGSSVLVAVDAEHVLALDGAKLTLHGGPVGARRYAPLAEWEGPAGGHSHAILYDAASATAYVVGSDSTRNESRWIRKFAIAAGGLKDAQVTTFTAPAQSGDAYRLSWDGRYLFYNDRAFDLAAGSERTARFPSRVIAATRDFVILGDGTLAHPETGAIVGTPAWGKLTAAAVSADGTRCWVERAGTAGEVREYEITTAERSIPANPTGGVPQPPVGPKPSDPKTPTTGAVKVTELATLSGPATLLTTFKYSDKHDLLVYTEVLGTTVLDAKTGQPLPPPKLDGTLRLRASDLAPDQAAVFANDGQNLHRLDLAARKWETRPFAGGIRLLALDGSTALVQVKVSNPATWAVVKWDGTEAKEVGLMEWAYLYELGYDPAAKALYALHSKTNNTAGAVLERYARDDDEFKSEGSKKFVGATPRVTLRPLTADGKYFVQNMKAVPTDLKSDAAATFSEVMLGSVGRLAVGGTGNLHWVDTTRLSGTLTYAAHAVTATADGRTVWVHNRDAKKFVKFQIDAEKK